MLQVVALPSLFEGPSAKPELVFPSLRDSRIDQHYGAICVRFFENDFYSYILFCINVLARRSFGVHKNTCYYLEYITQL